MTDEIRVAFWGDSLVVGLYATRNHTFRDLVMARLAAAYPDKTFSQLHPIGNPDHWSEACYDLSWGVPDVINAYHPHILVSEIGIHDAGRYPVSTYKTCYYECVEKITAHGCWPFMVMMGLWYPNAPIENYTAYIAVQQQAAIDWKMEFVDTSPIWTNPINEGPAGLPSWIYPDGSMLTDTFHPNDAGHALLADLVFNAIVDSGYFSYEIETIEATTQVATSQTITKQVGWNIS